MAGCDISGRGEARSVNHSTPNHHQHCIGIVIVSQSVSPAPRVSSLRHLRLEVGPRPRVAPPLHLLPPPRPRTGDE